MNAVEFHRFYCNKWGEDPKVHLFKAALIGVGGEHLVFRLPSHPRMVLKISLKKARDIAWTLIREQEIDKHIIQQYSLQVELLNRNSQLLWKYFNINFLYEKRYLIKLPADLETMKALFSDNYYKFDPLAQNKTIMQSYTFLCLQSFSNILNHIEKLSLNYGGFSEDKKVNELMYHRVTMSTLNRSYIHFFKVDEFITIQDSTSNYSIKTFIDCCKVDSNLKRTLESFLTNTALFANKTGQILALAGENNVVFTKTSNNRWDYILLDVIPYYIDPIIKLCIQIAKKIGSQKTIPKEDREILLRGLNFIRFINGICLTFSFDCFIKVPKYLSTINFYQVLVHDGKASNDSY